jgi:hypothetical protein
LSQPSLITEEVLQECTFAPTLMSSKALRDDVVEGCVRHSARAVA